MDGHRRGTPLNTRVWAGFVVARTGVPVGCALAAVATFGAWAAAAPVQESEGREIRRETGPLEVAGDDPAETPSEVNTIYYEFQLMQDEVRRLHGVVEELNHRIERLEGEQRERYIELDRRIVELRDGAGVVAGGEDGSPAPTSDTATVPATEREAYNVAIELVNTARPLPDSEQRPRYRRALGLFRDVIKDYPNGERTPNAFYWIGQLHFALKEYEDAREAFVQVVLLYDDHPKVPDALYKLGEVYHVLGDAERAREYLNRVINDFPTSTAAGLARTFLAELR